MVIPEDRSAFRVGILNAYQEMKTTTIERRIRDRSGQLRWLQTRCRPLRTEDGSLSWVGITLDMTSQKETEAALEDARQRFQEVTRFMPGAVFQAEVETDTARCTYVSEGGSEILGLDHATILADYRAVGRLVHAEDRDELQAAVQRSAARLERLDHEFPHQLPAGRYALAARELQVQGRHRGGSCWRRGR